MQFLTRLFFVVLIFVIFDRPSCRGDDVRFNEDIRPILAEHCLQCHGPDAEKREADLRLDIESAAKKKVIVAKNPERSAFLQRVASNDPDQVMPPPDAGKPLSRQQVVMLKRWILEGAKYEGHWAFEPIEKPKPPGVDGAAATEIDRFLLSKLKSAGLKMAQPISKQQLIRRATFDLTGLPPTWQQVQDFVNDKSPDAYKKLLDRLLESPRYGERWGRHWLDVARYADTLGGAAIGFKKFPFSYTYRDYVIHSFNDDVGYDRFIKEQLAADQLGLKENDPALAALGFLTVGMQYRNPHDTLDDQIDVVTRGMLGLTVACARCHDHKYDAIPTDDYYSLYATLASSTAPDVLPILGKPQDTKQYRDYQRELSLLQINREEMGREQIAVMKARIRMQVGLYLRELGKGTPEQDLSSALLSYRTDDLRPIILNRWRDYLGKLPADDPVFGLWLKLSKLKADDFAKKCDEIMQAMIKENGDISKLPAMEKLTATAPRWNPLVLDAVSKQKPKSLIEVADIYGKLFASIHQEWMKSVIEASLEAAVGAKVVPDEDPKHRTINSPIKRQLRRHLYATNSPTAITGDAAAKLLNRPVHDNLRGRGTAITNLDLNSPGAPARGMALVEDHKPRDFHVFIRGSAIARGNLVQARFLTALSPNGLKAFKDGKRRLGLAEAIVDPANPLTRRVVVNWAWQHHFGKGLVRTPDDFGTRGQPPTHPRLLDYLATSFLEQDDWSLKKLHRRIMMTAAYRQGAIENARARTIDPDNRLLWRMPRKRLELESMRDAMLAVSGELNTSIGGRPFNLLSKPIVPRRSVYAFVNRDIISSLSSTFDAANPNACTAMRPETTVPQQTLFALNSAFIQDRAAAMAARKELSAIGDDRERVQWMYRQAFSRSPDPQELQVAVRYVQSQDNQSKTNAWQRLAHVLLAANEFVFVD
ncbi:MAG: hypothetical protein CMJ78_13165 [Planctomycetaceae bacterium]|nr:hypothetical protein [Planctomycetaceae bacterium]